LIGPSGCGKSSFIYCLAGLIRQFPEARLSGRIELEGMPLYDGPQESPAVCQRIGVVFQKPVPFPFSIRKNMWLPLQERGIRDRDRLDAVTEAQLRRVGLWKEVRGRLNRPATILSGGQQQRLCIARALTLNPSVLLMDEPCSALDPLASGTVEDLIAELGRDQAVVLVTHNVAQARRIADEVAFFWFRDGSGVLIEHAEARRFFHSPLDPLTKMYLSGVRG